MEIGIYAKCIQFQMKKNKFNTFPIIWNFPLKHWRFGEVKSFDFSRIANLFSVNQMKLAFLCVFFYF